MSSMSIYVLLVVLVTGASVKAQARPEPLPTLPVTGEPRHGSYLVNGTGAIINATAIRLVVNGVTVQTVPRNQSAPGPRPHLPCMGRPDPMAPGPHRPRPDGPQNLDPRGPTDPCTAVPRGAVDPRAMGPRGPFDPRAMAPRPFERRPIPGMPGQEGPGGVGNPQDRPNPVTGRKMHL